MKDNTHKIGKNSSTLTTQEGNPCIYVEKLFTSKSIMSRGKGTSGFSPVSIIGMFAFLISFSTNPRTMSQSAHM